MKNKKFILGMLAFSLAIAVFVIADQTDLEAELAQLEGGLVDANYSWLVN